MKNMKLYIVVTHFVQADGKRLEEVRITNKLKKQYLSNAEVIIDVGNLRMEKDRYRDYAKEYDHVETALRYIETLSQRNKDVANIWAEFTKNAVDGMEQVLSEENAK